MYTTPDNKIRMPARQRLYSAPERMEKSKKEKYEEKVKKHHAIMTRKYSEIKLNEEDDYHFENLDEFKILENHTAKHECHICDKKFYHKKALEAHKLVHSTSDLFIPSEKCELCKRKFDSKLKLKLHNKKHHSNGVISMKILAVL